MSKGFLTAKAIGNRIKAKGLQKLRWYCQMCEKQCRDENGFKCHCLSETHTRQMALFRDDPSKFMDQYSRDFEGFFMAVMKRKGGMRVRANTVYQEVVADRTHIHMNSTKWETLGTFVQYLGKTGLCRVDQTEKGWYVQYIDRDPRFLARQEEIAKRTEQSMDEEERASERIQKQIEEATKAEEAAKHALMEAAAAAGGNGTGEDADEEHKATTAHSMFDHAQPTEIHERGEEEKIVFSLSAPHTFHGAATAATSSTATAPAAAAAAASSAASTAASSSSLAASSSSAAVPAASSSASAPSSFSAAAAVAAAAVPAASSTPFVKPAAPFMMSFARPSMLSAFGGGGAADSGESSSSSKRKAPAPSHTSSTLSALMAENERIKTQEQAAKKLKADAAPPKPVAAAAASSSSSAAAGAGSSSKRLGYWLFPNLIVKVLNKKLLGGSLYKQKGVVVRVHDKYVAELRLLAGGPGAAAEGTVLRIDQDELESVIPAVGKLVQVVNGTYRGEIAVLLDLNEAKYTAKLRIESGVLRGKEVEGIEYEDICKLNEA